MGLLDRPEVVKAVDKGGMLQAIESMPEQLIEALEASRYLSLKNIKRSRIHKIIIGGVGGSAIAGDILTDWVRDKLTLPLAVCRDSTLPAYADRDCLAIMISYSGETLETLAAFKDALDRGCQVMAVGSGGSLERLALKHGLNFFKVKTGLQPRAALPSLLVGAAALLSKLDLIRGFEADVRKAAEEVRMSKRKFGVMQPLARNEAKRLSMQILGRHPFIYTLERNASLARRFKTQLNENAKILASFATLPESCHNDVEAWGFMKRFEGALRPIAVFLRESEETKFERAIFDEMARALKRTGRVKVEEFRSEAKSRLGSLLSTVLFCDLVSAYVAILRRVNPTPVRHISRLKARILSRLKG